MIDSYHFGKIVIDGKKYTSDVIIYPDRVDSNWWREDGHLLSLQDLEGVFAGEPETLIIGTGSLGLMKVPEEVRRSIEERGIKLIAARTKAACGEYNRLCGNERVICGLHLTC